MSYIYFKGGKAISHRSFIKVLLNPLLRRMFGVAIGSLIEDNTFIKYKIIKQSEPKYWSFKPDFDYDYKIKC